MPGPPAPDCDCDAVDLRFDAAYATEKLERYRASGPDPSTQALLAALEREGVGGLTLLDIGGGVGAIQHELLERGLATAQEVEASVAYAATCHAEAEVRGHAERISHVTGDFDSVRDIVEPADIVTLDRSVCCWPEPLRLIASSAPFARRLYGLVYPRDTWWVRHLWRTWGNARQVLKRTGLRLSTPRTPDIEAVLAQEGLYPRHRAAAGVWQVAVFKRVGDVPTG